MTILLLLTAQTAHAQCASPAGTSGNMMYNQNESVMQYCDGTSWIAMGTASATTLSAMPPTPYAYWPFEDGSGSSTADDTVGSNDGTLVSMETSTDWVTGVKGGALQFDGSEYVDMPQDELDITGDLTFAAWIYPSGAAESDVPLGFAENFSGGEYGVLIGTSALEWRCFANAPYVNYTNVNVNGVNNKWWHIACVYDGAADVLTMYVNGAPVDTQGISDLSYPTTPYVPRRFRIGGDSGGGNFNGTVDEVVIYDRVLSESEIIQLMQASGGISGNIETGLVGHWKFDDGPGSSTATNSAGSINGTLTNMDTVGDWVAYGDGYALDFDGTDDHVRLGTSSTLNLNGSITVSAWINPRDMGEINGSNTYGTVYSRISGSSGFSLYTVDNGNVGDRDIETYTNGFNVTPSAALPISLNEWQHVAGVVDSTTNTGYLYVNGTLVGSGSFNTPSVASAQAIIGSYTTVGEDTFDGLIDDVRIYNRALGVEEIIALSSGSGCLNPSGSAGNLIYNNSTNQMQYCNGTGWIAMGPSGGVQAPANGLLSHWKLDETSGSSIADSSVNSYTGSWNESGADDVSAETVPGQVDTALDFSDNDYISFPSLTIPDEGTFSAWLTSNFVEANCPLSNFPILMWAETPVTGLFYNCSTEQYNLVTNGTFGQATYSPPSDFTGWFHLTATWSTSGSQIYLNGQPVGTPGVGDDSSNSPSGGFILGDRTALDREWDGAIDDVRIYDRALSASEVEQLFIATAGSDPLTGLAGHWTLDETSGTSAADTSGNGNTGTLTDGASFTSAYIGNGVILDGSDDSIDIANESFFDYEYSDPFSISAWIYRETNTTEDDVVEKWDSGGGGVGYYLYFPGGTNDLHFGMSQGAAGYVKSVSGITTGSWHHVAGTYDGTGISGLNIYVDGLIQSTTTEVNGLPSSILNNYQLTVGGDQPGSSCCGFDGTIDDVRIYNRELSAADVAILFAAGNSGTSNSCTNPSGNSGNMLYNSTYDVMQYCNGQNWVPVGKVP